MIIELEEIEKIRILNSDDLYGIMQRILQREQKIDQNREHFWVVGLANDHGLLFVELISLGSINQTVVQPMEVFSLALQKRAVKIMLVHNHPSGTLTPSEDDKDITDRLIQVGIIVNLHVLDHLIISRHSYLSFVQIGLLDELKKSKKYVPAFMQVEQAQKEAAEMTKQKLQAAKAKYDAAIIQQKAKPDKKTLEMAKELKRQGVADDIIAKSTGLPLEEVEKLRVKKKA